MIYLVSLSVHHLRCCCSSNGGSYFICIQCILRLQNQPSRIDVSLSAVLCLLLHVCINDELSCSVSQFKY